MPGEPPTISLHDAARGYAALGWHVFPVDPNGKAPLTTHGHLDASTDYAIVAAWWSAHPDARIGLSLRPSGLLVIDYDVGAKKSGDRTLQLAEQVHGPLPRGLVQRSGNGGGHIFFRDPSPGPNGWTRRQEDGGCLYGNLNHLELGASVDVKCNGFVVLAPSGKYRWVTTDYLPDLPIAWQRALYKLPDDDEAPTGIDDWEHSITDLSFEQEAVLRGVLKALPAPGQGRSATFQVARVVHHDFGLSLKDGWSYVLAWHESHGSPRAVSDLRRQVRRAALRSGHQDRGWRLGVATDHARRVAACDRMLLTLDQRTFARTVIANAPTEGPVGSPKGQAGEIVPVEKLFASRSRP